MFQKLRTTPNRCGMLRLLSTPSWGTAAYPKIDVSKLFIEKTPRKKEKIALPDLLFGKNFADHMLQMDWHAQTNTWDNLRISEHKALELPPGCSSLHYGLQCFEGMKAYKDNKGKIRMFRPDMNMKRMDFSMRRLAFPGLDKEGFLECIKKLLLVDQDWIPAEEGYSMYIRPTAIATSPHLGVMASDMVKLFCILSPVGPYFRGGFKPIKLFADTENSRAWPGGAGNSKVGGNYGPTIAPGLKAAQYGCSQVLWLFGEDHQITEVGAMNIFFVIKKKGSDVVELVTAPLTRGDILPGVTRDSVLGILRAGELGSGIEVSERWLRMKEVVEAQKEGRLLEVFGAGTAVVISPVKSILYNGQEIVVPTGEGVGDVAMKLWKRLYDIQYGKVSHPWSIVIN